MMCKNKPSSSRWSAGGLRPCWFALLGLVLLAGLVLSQCGSNGVGGSGGDPLAPEDDSIPLLGPPTIAAGTAHSCGLRSGQAFCWGSDAFGRLGHNRTGHSPSPVAVWDVGGTMASPGMLTGVTAIVAGGADHSCALRNGQVACWGGDNDFGELGCYTLANTDRPCAVRVTPGATASMLMEVTAITAGSAHTCALQGNQGRALCWGSDDDGRLGNGTAVSGIMGDQEHPVAVLGVTVGGVTAGTLMEVTAITAGDEHTCAVASGQALCWGNDGDGRLGDGEATVPGMPMVNTKTQLSPVAVRAVGGAANSMLTGVTAITAGDSHTCALQGGQALCWGNDDDGQLGDGLSSTTPQHSPVAVRAVGGAGVLTGVFAITAGRVHTCALQGSQSRALCWGKGSAGQLGNGMNKAKQHIPLEVRDGAGVLTGFTTISAGNAHTCAIAIGVAFCWGKGGSGRLGDGTVIDRPSPVPVVQ